MGFSLAGLTVSLSILLPNLAMALFARPCDQPQSMPAIPLAVIMLERAGQAGCLVLPALTSKSAPLDVWFVLVAVTVTTYWALWVRYLVTGRRFTQLYASLGPIPVPMAVMPILAFAATAVWLTSWPLTIAAAALALGHLITTLRIARSLTIR